MGVGGWPVARGQAPNLSQPNALMAAPSGQAASIRSPLYSTRFTSWMDASSGILKPLVSRVWAYARSRQKKGRTSSAIAGKAAPSSASAVEQALPARPPNSEGLMSCWLALASRIRPVRQGAEAQRRRQAVPGSLPAAYLP